MFILKKYSTIVSTLVVLDIWGVHLIFLCHQTEIKNFTCSKETKKFHDFIILFFNISQVATCHVWLLLLISFIVEEKEYRYHRN